MRLGLHRRVGVAGELLEADVEFNVAKRFLARVKEKSLGEVVTLKAELERFREQAQNVE